MSKSSYYCTAKRCVGNMSLRWDDVSYGNTTNVDRERSRFNVRFYLAFYLAHFLSFYLTYIPYIIIYTYILSFHIFRHLSGSLSGIFSGILFGMSSVSIFDIYLASSHLAKSRDPHLAGETQ